MQFPVIRQLTDPDRRHLRPHFKVLDATDRRLRFGAAIDDAAIDRYVDLIDFDTDAVLSVADASGRLIAVAHVAPGGEGAELGLSVHQVARGAGLESLSRERVHALPARKPGHFASGAAQRHEHLDGRQRQPRGVAAVRTHLRNSDQRAGHALAGSCRR